MPLALALCPADRADPVRDTTLASVLCDAAAAAPDAVALIEAEACGRTGRRWTYAALLADAQRLADALLARYAPGERIALWAPNTPEWVLVEFAAAFAGLVLVTINPAYQGKELHYVLTQSRSVGLLHVAAHRGNPLAQIAREVCATLPLVREIVDLDDAAALYARPSPPRSRPVVAPDDAAQVQYTSGTTGFPKGAVLSHRSLTNNARYSATRAGLAAGDTYLNSMPLFHTAGCALGVLGAVQQRSRLVLQRQFDAAGALALIETERVTGMIAVPTMIAAMLDAQAQQPRATHTLRGLVSGGACVPPELVARTRAALGCDVDIVYGQTETAPGLTQTCADDPPALRSTTIGRPFPQTEIKIHDIATGSVAPLGAVGEICARGYCVMLGYNDDPAATAAAIDADGWLHTGDLGTMDARGYVRITGRLKDMIIRGGENLYPAEIENVLIAHPAVAEAVVVGVPDAYWGEIAVAFVRPRDGATLEVADLVRHLRRELAAPKTPAQWIVVDAFPLTASGKVQRYVLRERWLAGDYVAQRLQAQA